MSTINGACVETDARRDKDGYGIVTSRVHGTRRAHRVAWIEANGPIPPGMFVCHRCDNPPCIRPGHLFLGTAVDNNRDAAAKMRYPWQNPERCRQGHKRWGQRKQGRYCLECNRIKVADFKARARAGRLA